MIKTDFKYRLAALKNKEAESDTSLKRTLSQLFAGIVIFGCSVSGPSNDKVEAYVLPSQLTTDIRLTELASATVEVPKNTKSLIVPRIFPSPYKQKNKEDIFTRAVQISLENEGVYTRRDSNGYPAKYGINQRYYRPLKGYPRRVEGLTKQQAISYYRTFYYQSDWDRKGYSTTYKAFLLDSAIQHGCTVKQIENASKGNLHKAVNYRLAHVRRWASRSGNQRLLAGMERRIRSYEKRIV